MDAFPHDRSACSGRDIPAYRPRASEVAEHLVRHAQRFPHLHCYVLADPTLRDCRLALHGRLSELGESDPLSATTVRMAPGRLDKSHWPLLIELAPARRVDSELLTLTCAMAVEDWHPDSLRQGNGHRIAGWLFSAEPASSLATHLSAACVRARNPTRRTLIRFYDPSVLDLAWEDMNDAQRRALLGPIDHWQQLGRDGRVTSHAVEDDAGQANGRTGKAFTGPDLSEHQWMRLDQIGPFNRAWRRIARTGSSPDREVVRNVRQAMLRADEYGFRDADDLVEFAWRAFSTSAWFDRHPRVQQCIRAATPGESFGLLTAGFTDADWQTIGMESQQETGA